MLLWYSSAKTNRVFGVPQSSACRGVLNQNTKAEDLLSFPRNVSDDHFAMMVYNFGKLSYVILEQSPMSAWVEVIKDCSWQVYLPSELSSKQGGSEPRYFCSRTLLSPGSRPGIIKIIETVVLQYYRLANTVDICSRLLECWYCV